MDGQIVTQDWIDQRIYDLYDEYCHGAIDRRTFLSRAAAATVGGLAMAQALMPRYANAQTISFTDERIVAKYVTYPSPGGNSGQMRGYLVQPAGTGPFPAVLVIHENRGLTPHIEDVARRLALEGFLAYAPDMLTSLGGTPADESNYVYRAMELAARRAGRPLPPARIEIETDVPLARGLGSSAAALVADVHPIFKAHLFLGMTIFLVFPFTRLVHVWSAPVWYLGRRGYQVVRSRRPYGARQRPSSAIPAE